LGHLARGARLRELVRSGAADEAEPDEHGE
jgi:hypothetical protein